MPRLLIFFTLSPTFILTEFSLLNYPIPASVLSWILIQCGLYLFAGLSCIAVCFAYDVIVCLSFDDE